MILDSVFHIMYRKILSLNLISDSQNKWALQIAHCSMSYVKSMIATKSLHIDKFGLN
jgi:hypothetical protein